MGTWLEWKTKGNKILFLKNKRHRHSTRNMDHWFKNQKI